MVGATARKNWSWPSPTSSTLFLRSLASFFWALCSHLSYARGLAQPQHPLSQAPSTETTHASLILFGSNARPWKTEDWVQVSDSIRGGCSFSKFHLVDQSLSVPAVSFQGTLDSKTLGGAGFTSQAYRRHPIALPKNLYNGLFLDVLPIEHSGLSRFTLNLKNSLSEHSRLSLNQAGHTRDKLTSPEASLSYEYDFTVPFRASSPSSAPHGVRILVPFRDLKPTFRGRPQPDAPPFDSASILEISLMCRSFFNQQSGPFRLTVLRIGATDETPTEK